jgi:hypothetical protein
MRWAPSHDLQKYSQEIRGRGSKSWYFILSQIIPFHVHKLTRKGHWVSSESAKAREGLTSVFYFLLYLWHFKFFSLWIRVTFQTFYHYLPLTFCDSLGLGFNYLTIFLPFKVHSSNLSVLWGKCRNGTWI